LDEKLSQDEDTDCGEEHRIISVNMQRICDYIRHNPGCHLRKIIKEFSIGMGNTMHYLILLEKEGFIKSKRMGMYKTYYTISDLGERHESILAVLQHETPRDIILFLIENPGATQGEIARHLSFTASTINWHMSRLIEIDLVYNTKEGRFMKYYLKGDVNDIIKLLKLYHSSIWSKLSDRVAQIFLDISEVSQAAGSNTSENDNVKNNNNLLLAEEKDNHMLDSNRGHKEGDSC
jgi:DNA-binding transcriptional ArsR family regulator